MLSVIPVHAVTFCDVVAAANNTATIDCIYQGSSLASWQLAGVSPVDGVLSYTAASTSPVISYSFTAGSSGLSTDGVIAIVQGADNCPLSYSSVVAPGSIVQGALFENGVETFNPQAPSAVSFAQTVSFLVGGFCAMAFVIASGRLF